MPDILFEPLQLRNLTVKNRLWRSNMAGRFDNYDGSGNPARINWELKFARGGAGAIVSSFVAVNIRGRILPNYATIDSDERIPFWRELGRRVHEHDCRFIMQLSHGGRQRDIGGIEFETGLSSTDKPEPLNGFPCERMTVEQIESTVEDFAEGARRAREAGLDGVELHAANGYLFTQFLSSAMNDRTDQYGGTLENRARFLLDVIRAIRRKVGDDFHVQVKISTTEFNNALTVFEPAGNTLEDSVKVCKWAEQAGADAIVVSAGSSFPHPKNPPGDFPTEEAVKTIDAMISSGSRVRFNFALLSNPAGAKIFRTSWQRARGDVIEGINLVDSRRIKEEVGIPVLCTGGFQTASFIRAAIAGGACDAVTIARSFIANNDLPKIFAAGQDTPERPCTYCNKCLVNVLENPLGCYEQDRYPSREAMVADILSVFDPPPFS
jgi:2,4-dienoyl-CoA reductase-like NADH-dependent reductase (Old Yellow Enzyme family)